VTNLKKKIRNCRNKKELQRIYREVAFSECLTVDQKEELLEGILLKASRTLIV
jgi:hypothetical protein